MIHSRKIIYVGAILTVFLVVFVLLPVTYLNITGSKIEKICNFIIANKKDPAVLSKVEIADSVEPDFKDPNVIRHYYSVKWFGGPSCIVRATSEGKVLEVSFLPD